MEGYTVPQDSQNAIYIVIKDREYRVSANSKIGYVRKMQKIPVGTQIVVLKVNTNPDHPDYFQAKVLGLDIIIEAISFTEVIRYRKS